MSQYRDDRDAARQRVEALEAKLAERDREIEDKGRVIAERDEEIARLRREVELTGAPGRRKPAQARWAVRLVGLAVGVAGVAMALGVWVIRAPRGNPAPTLANPVEVARVPEPVIEPPAPTLADPVKVARVPEPVAEPPAPTLAPAPALADPVKVARVPAPAIEPPSPTSPSPSAPSPPGLLDEDALRAQLEPKVWAGRASVDEIRMLKAICSYQGDRDCRDRAAKLIPQARPSGF